MGNSDLATNVALQGADDAFKEHIGELYRVLKTGLQGKDQDAREHAANGVRLARETLKALQDAIRAGQNES